MSGTSQYPCKKFTNNAHARCKHLSALPLAMKLLAVAHTEVSEAYSDDAAIDILNIL